MGTDSEDRGGKGKCSEKKERKKEREYGSQIARKRKREREREREKRRVKKEGEREKDQCNSNGFKRVVFKARRPKESAGVEKGGTGTKNRDKNQRKREKGTRMKRKERREHRSEEGRSFGKGWNVVRDRKGGWTTYGAAGNIRLAYFFAFQSNFVKRPWGETFPLFKRTLLVRFVVGNASRPCPRVTDKDDSLESDSGTLPLVFEKRENLLLFSVYFPGFLRSIKLPIDRLCLAICSLVNFSCNGHVAVLLHDTWMI